MTRTEAIILSALVGLFFLLLIAFLLVLFVPAETLFGPTPTATSTATLVPTPTATFPNFMPTPGSPTATVPPSVTNTPLPTSTPRPTNTQTPTRTITPTPEPATATSTLAPQVEPPGPTFDPASAPTPTVSLQYNIQFSARNPSIRDGDCTFLEWRVVGSNNVFLEGESVSPSGREEVCPERNTTYQLQVQLPDGITLSESTTVNVR